MEKGAIVKRIQRELGGIGTPGMTEADEAYSMAIDHIASLDWVPWNKKADTFATISGTATYDLGDDVLSDYDDILGISSLWHTATQGDEIILYNDVGQFNAFGRGSTSTGKPQLGVVYGTNNTLELYPIPDAAYTLWAYLRFPLTLSNIPEIYQKILIWDAVMIGVNADEKPNTFNKAEKFYKRIVKAIKGESGTKWRGTRVVPEYVYGNYTSGRNLADSGRYWGGLG